LKGEKSDLLAFDDGELSADSDEEEKTNNTSVQENGIKKKKKSKVIQLILFTFLSFSEMLILLLHDFPHIQHEVTQLCIFTVYSHTILYDYCLGRHAIYKTLHSAQAIIP
jgi:hypothetical protein